jgi:hypothetical protein
MPCKPYRAVASGERPLKPPRKRVDHFQKVVDSKIKWSTLQKLPLIFNPFIHLPHFFLNFPFQTILCV